MDFQFKNVNQSSSGQCAQTDYGPEFEESKIKIKRGFWAAIAVGVLTLLLAVITNFEAGILAIIDSVLFLMLLP